MERWKRIALWTFLLALVATTVWLWRWMSARSAGNELARLDRLRATIHGPIPTWLPGDSIYHSRIWGEIRRAYENHDYRPLWIRQGTPTAAAYALAVALAKAPVHGLEPQAYGEPEIRRALATPLAGPLVVSEADAELLASLDVRLTAAFVRFVRERHDGRLPASVLDPDWVALRDTVDVAAALKRTLRSRDPAQSITEMARAEPAYVGLQGAIGAYRLLVAQGGWPEIPAEPPLTVGKEDPLCLVLRRRLASTGDIVNSSGAALFDAALEHGLRRFQKRHGIPTTGRLDDMTRKAMNVTAAERLRTLELNLERRRWVPAMLPKPAIRVNIPESRLRLVSDGADSFTMPVVLGTPSNPTPVFSDVVTHLEFHPTWGIPKGIVAREVLPSYRRNKNHFLEKQMRVVSASADVISEVDPATVPWERIGDDLFPFFVRQDPGPTNPLGQIKFMCLNEYDVYLHDTPMRRHFAYAARFLSHGCVRVRDPVRLAACLLRGTPVASPDSIQAILASPVRRRVGLRRRTPVHIEYWTSWVNDSGAVEFRDDIYQLDRRLDVALRGGSISRFEINPGVSRNPHWTPRRAK